MRRGRSPRGDDNAWIWPLWLDSGPPTLDLPGSDEEVTLADGFRQGPMAARLTRLAMARGRSARLAWPMTVGGRATLPAAVGGQRIASSDDGASAWQQWPSRVLWRGRREAVDGGSELARTVLRVAIGSRRRQSELTAIRASGLRRGYRRLATGPDPDACPLAAAPLSSQDGYVGGLVKGRGNPFFSLTLSLSLSFSSPTAWMVSSALVAKLLLDDRLATRHWRGGYTSKVCGWWAVVSGKRL
uniref:Uncharacterized protein n=1 Tax=Oryza nivara TaxID=4536 RepID=A0A0E0IG63_ORYNI